MGQTLDDALSFDKPPGSILSEFGTLGVFLAIFGFLIDGFFGSICITQHYRLATYLPVSGQVVSSTVQTYSGSRSTFYGPAIKYRYVVNGVQYAASRVYPSGNIFETGDTRSWARSVAARYPPNTITTAWYSPVDPSSAFLIHEVASRTPHIMLLFPGSLFGIGTYLIVISRYIRRQPTTPIPDYEGWFKVPEENFRGRVRINLAVAVCWYVFAAIVIADYLSLVRQIDVFFCAVAPICATAVGLFFLIPAWQWWKLTRDFLPADFRISHPLIYPDDTIRLRLRQAMRRNLQIERASLGLVCLRGRLVRCGRSTYRNTLVVSSEWKDLVVNRFYRAGTPIDLTDHFHVPANAGPSSPKNSRYGYNIWRLVVEIVAQGEPKRTVYFPVAVQARP